MGDSLDLSVLAKELQALESEVFEIVDYTETYDLLSAVKAPAPAPSQCSTASCSTCSSTTSTTSCCA
ncbi:thiazolylpeptide-type bacteriocin [Streptacidiphilus sp. PAMC 29251]